MVKKFFENLFGVSRAKLQAQLDWARAENYAHSEMIKMLQVRLGEQSNMLQKQADQQKKFYVFEPRWKSVTKGELVRNKTYWVVSQGGFYEIKGVRLISGACSQVTQFALNNGYVVATRVEAEYLLNAMRALVGRV